MWEIKQERRKYAWSSNYGFVNQIIGEIVLFDKREEGKQCCNYTANEMLVLLLVVASMLTLLLTRQKRGVSPNVTDTLTNRLHVSAFFVQNHAY